MQKDEVGGRVGVPGGKGFGIGESAFLTDGPKSLRSRPARATRARWPDYYREPFGDHRPLPKICGSSACLTRLQFFIPLVVVCPACSRLSRWWLFLAGGCLSRLQFFIPLAAFIRARGCLTCLQFFYPACGRLSRL